MKKYTIEEMRGRLDEYVKEKDPNNKFEDISSDFKEVEKIGELIEEEMELPYNIVTRKINEIIRFINKK